MKSWILPLFVSASATVAAGCGASYPVPTQRMADTESAERSARELGADRNPTAQLHLKLADDQLAQAKVAVKNGDNKRADLLLLRARADAELAVALSREQDANSELQKLNEKTTAAATAAANGAK